MLSPTRFGLTKLLYTIFACARSLNISFDPSKSNFAHFTKSRHHDTIFYYNNVDHHFQDQVKYLGMQFSYNLCDLSSINSLRHQISLCCNSISQLLRNAHYGTPITLIKANCLHLYGTELILIRNFDTFETVECTWNRNIRKA